MNERIKQLSEIAYKNHLRNNPESSFGRRADYDKEFAELIISECADLCDRFQSRDVGMQPAECAGAIRNMFGIKE